MERKSFSDEPLDQLKILADWMKHSNYTVILTGAGISTDSGIPDYRSKVTGLWRKNDPMEVSTAHVIQNQYDVFFEYFTDQIIKYGHVQPNVGHQMISQWEQRGLIDAVITQNVDGLHQLAGSKKVLEMHGTARAYRCQVCDRESEQQSFLNREKCPNCGGHIRPNVVLFDEMLSPEILSDAERKASKSDLMLVIGASLDVSPVNQFPWLVQGKVVLINLDTTGFDDQFNLVIHGEIKDILPQLNSLL